MLLRAVVLVALLSTAARAEDDLANRTIIFARGNKLVKTDARGKGDVDIATLPDQAQVRALRTDAQGKVLLADINGTWSWMKLDGSASSLTPLPCDPGPAHVTEDAMYVLCRKNNASLVVNLGSGRLTPLNIATAGARLVGTGAERKLIWADDRSVWSATPPKLKPIAKVAPEVPLRGLLPSPDGSHALGTYKGEIYENARKKTEGEVLMVFALDGQAARRKAIQAGVPIEWSHDSKWVLVQDGANACIMLAAGGQYKCWKGYTAAAISPDGKYALVLGNRRSDDDDDKKAKKSKKSKKDSSSKKKKKKEREPAPEPTPEPTEDVEGEGELPTDDVPVAPPSGPLALYRAQLDGAYTTTPQLVSRVVDGAAVFVP
jgi:hypothetical protein